MVMVLVDVIVQSITNYQICKVKYIDYIIIC